MSTIWIDIANTAEIPFFIPIIQDLKDREYKINLTCWNRGEVPRLLHSLGLEAKVILSDYSNPFKKALSVGIRSILLSCTPFDFDVVVTMENVMPLLGAHLRKKVSVIILDNDVKLNAPQSIFQKLENKVKKLARYVLVPEVAFDEFSKFFGRDMLTYNGYKEHVSISNYTPDPDFVNNLPFDEYIVIRPESLASHYVMEKRSIIPELLKLFVKEGINIVYLPRNALEMQLVTNYIDDNVYIPHNPLNGLDLSYYSKAVLTGSGTMAREATLLGVPAVSFFPGKQLLAIDKNLINKRKLFHSRDPQKIFEYVMQNWDNKRRPEFKKAKQVKREILEYITSISSGG